MAITNDAASPATAARDHAGGAAVAHLAVLAPAAAGLVELNFTDPSAELVHPNRRCPSRNWAERSVRLPLVHASTSEEQLELLDLDQLLARMANVKSSRSEADLQSDIKLLLLHGGLDLDEHDLDVALESPVGAGKRIDVEIGRTVIEVKRNLSGKAFESAVAQLADYLRLRSEETEQRYVGVLTDGHLWNLYSLDLLNEPSLITGHTVDPSAPDVEALKIWLEGVLATKQNISPTPFEIHQRLGAGTSSFRLDKETLVSLYQSCRSDSEIQVKRMLWARLLTTAFGEQFNDDDDLFLEHTYLTIIAELLAHLIIGYDVRHEKPATLLSGKLFSEAQISGVVEEDFFDWVVAAPGGEKFIRDVARRISRFDWSGVQHDVLKVLYESVIDRQQRHSLGEYYTPDWLAERMVDEVVTDPLDQRVLDPSCGSGTFLFFAVRKYLAAADHAGIDNATAVAGVAAHVYGVDVHPVAVTLARVTYLLAIGLDRLQDRRALAIPVSIGDSLQWAQTDDLYTDGALVIRTNDGAELMPTELRFPSSIAQDSAKFDRLVDELAVRATARDRGSKPWPSIKAILNRHRVPEEARPTTETTFKLLCKLHDEGRNGIWGYYVRNLAQPFWLSLTENKPDVLVGNPPWLSYRFMTQPMREKFREEAEARQLWAGSEVATSQDLSGYFVARCCQLYLRTGGKFAFVMPHAVLARPHFEGFRVGEWTSLEVTRAAFELPWDVEAVRPHLFPMPACVVHGKRMEAVRRMGDESVHWHGRLPGENAPWDVAKIYLSTTTKSIQRPPTGKSPYGRIFRQGATIVPRGLMTVELVDAGPLGVALGSQKVRTMKSSQEKEPWRSVPRIEGTVERQFIRTLYLGASLIPYRCLPPKHTVIPLVDGQLMAPDDPDLERFPGLAKWWGEVAALWTRYSKLGSFGILERINYQRLLQIQFPPVAHTHRVIYNRSGTRLIAAYVEDREAVIDTKLYWGALGSRAEAMYLCSIFNAPLMTELVNPIQGRGNFGPRDFYSLPFAFPIPLFEDSDDLHQELSAVGTRSAALIEELVVADGSNWRRARQEAHKILGDSHHLSEANELVKELLLA